MSNTRDDFIAQIAPLIQKYAPQYGISVCSPIIAQAVLESASGTSNKVYVINSDNSVEWRHNYFGLKYRENRCPASNGFFEEKTAEQNQDKTYKNIVSKFFRFPSLEACVIGYFQFISISNYANLKGVTDPEEYLKLIKEDKYATSIDYVNKVMNVVNSCNLTKYDNLTGDGKKMIINVHAGHNPDGKTACGAIGFIKESAESRKVKDEVISQLRQLGHTVYDCTVANGTSQSDVLKKIVEKCNAHTVDLDVSIHFNSGAGDNIGNGNTTGTEVYVYSTSSKAAWAASGVCSAISDLGFKNRGVKINQNLYVLKHTSSPAMLIECCFVDDKDDVQLYNAQKMAEAIVYGITGQKVEQNVTGNHLPAGAEAPVENPKKLYRVQVGAYSIPDNAKAMQDRLKKAGFDAIIVSS